MKFLRRLFVISKKTFPLHFYHPENSFFKNSLIHFASTLGAIGENNWYFNNFKMMFPCGEFHFDLKSVTDEFDFVQINSFKNFLSVTNKARRSIFHTNTGYEPYINTCILR